MRQFILITFLLFNLVAAVSAQENATQNQAKIWHKALQWIYEDNNRTVGQNNQKPVPLVSSESLTQFEKDLAAASKNKQDEYNFYTRLYQPVKAKLTKNQPFPEKALIEEIVTEAAKKSDRNTQNLRMALETTLLAMDDAGQQNLPAEIPETSINAEENLASQQPEKDQEPTANLNQNENDKAETNMPLYLSIAALLLAAIALFRSTRKSNNRSVTSVRPSEGFSNAKGVPVQGNQNVNALKKEIDTLKKHYNILKKENDNWRTEMQNAIQELQKSTHAAPLISEKYGLAPPYAAQQLQQQTQPVSNPDYKPTTEDYSIDTNHLFTEGQPQAQNQTRYTRVPEDGQIKEKDLHYDSQETWSFIEITIPENGTNNATFRVNPHVNHALAINNSLDRLENAFEFARSANKATQIINDADGELIKTTQGWQISKRAKIHLA